MTRASVAVRAGVRTVVRPLELDAVAVDSRRDLSRPQRHLAAVPERRGGGQGDGDHHHAEVDDHAAVGASHQPPPRPRPVRCGAAGGQHELADVGGGGESSQAEGHERAEPPHPAGHARHDDERADPGRDDQPVAQRAGRRLAPRQGGADRP